MRDTAVIGSGIVLIVLVGLWMRAEILELVRRLHKEDEQKLNQIYHAVMVEFEGLDAATHTGAAEASVNNLFAALNSGAFDPTYIPLPPIRREPSLEEKLAAGEVGDLIDQLATGDILDLGQPTDNRPAAKVAGWFWGDEGPVDPDE